MTEDQKLRYRKLLSDQKQGKSVDFVQFQKSVEEEKKAEKTTYSPFGNPPIPMEKIDWKAYSPLSWLNETIGG